MKLSGKKILALIMALTMCVTMVSAFATETETETETETTTPSIAITSVKVLNNATDTGTEYVTDAGIGTVSLTPAQLLQVTATVSGGVEDAQVSFFSYLSTATEYTDGTIQYLDQTAVSSGVATFTFRPRYDNNTFVAMTGATGVAAAAQFTYSVAAANVDMTVTGGATYPANAIVDTTFTINAVIPEIASVKIGNATLEASQYTVTTGEETTTVTILASAIPTTVGSHTVTISASGYNDGSGTIVITAAEVEIENEDDKAAAEEEVAEKAAEITTTTTTTITKTTTNAEGETEEVQVSVPSVSLADTASTVENATVIVEVDEDKLGAGFSVVNDTLIFDNTVTDAPFVGKADITVKVNSEISTTKTVYFIPEGITISYGNITALTNGTDDAFALTGDTYEEKNNNFKTWVEENKAAVDTAEDIALAIGAGRTSDTSSVAAIEDTLDFNRKDGISLNEYNIYRKMIGGFDGFEITTVNTYRNEHHPKSSD